MPNKMIRQLSIVASFVTLAACAAERTVAPHAPASTASSSLSAPQVPLLYVVDGVRLQRDQVPALTGDQIASVQVLKGRAALREFGPDASYGVVVIKTKQASPAT
jgi:hypothetical protein